MKAMTAEKIARITGGSIIVGNPESVVTDVCTDSRKAGPGMLFVPIVGANVDAHDFIPAVIKQKASAAFTSRKEESPEYFCEGADSGINADSGENTALIAVEDTRDALQELGRWYRAQYPEIPVIGITGSVGKTTTKEMIAAALEPSLKVLKTAGNMNSQVGLPQMMLRLEKSHRAAVIEMGMSEPGEMERLARIAKPGAAVLTNIGVSHIGQLGSKENIRKEKLGIINAFDGGSVLFVNGDDPLLKTLLTDPDSADMSELTREKFRISRIEGFGTGEDLAYRAENIRYQENKTYFTYRTRNGEPREIMIPVLGIHNVYNALAALAVAEYLGIPASHAKEGLAAYRPAAMRGQAEEYAGVLLVDDTYNASPDSMKGSIELLMGLSGVKRRIAVFADILELGELSKDCHYGVGAEIAARAEAPDFVFSVGMQAAYITEAIRESGRTIGTEQFSCNREAAEYLKKLLKPGDAVIIKGSRGMKTEEIADELRAYLKK